MAGERVGAGEACAVIDIEDTLQGPATAAVEQWEAESWGRDQAWAWASPTWGSTGGTWWSGWRQGGAAGTAVPDCQPHAE